MAEKASIGLLFKASLQSLSKGQLPPSSILAMLLSKALGIVIIAGGSVVKLPQIAALLKSKSAAGISELSVELENVALMVHASYGFLMRLPLNSYGEAAIMLLQNSVLLALMYRYARTGWMRVLAVAGFNVAFVFSVLTGRISTASIAHAYDLNNVVVLASRVPQILQNHRTKNTGQLSIVTFVANVLGCIARIFTSYQEGGGIVMIRGFVLGLALNLAIAIQILLYRPKEKQAKKLN